MVEQLRFRTGPDGTVAVRLDLEWQLFDAKQRRLRYEQRVTGYAEAANTVVEGVFTAFSDALQRLLATTAFLAQVSPSPLQPYSPHSFLHWPTSPLLPHCSPARPHQRLSYPVT